jgi:hypothetical protein
MSEKIRSRAWVITWNNWTSESKSQLKELPSEYLCYAEEVGEKTHTPHLQGYVYMKNAMTCASMVKKCPGCFFMKANGSPTESRTYCKGPYLKEGHNKPENPTFVEIGKIPSQGQRTDIEATREAIAAGKRGRELHDDHTNVVWKYLKATDTYIGLCDEEKAHKMYESGFTPEVHVLWGNPGVGKSRSVLEMYGSRNIYIARKSRSGGIWWNGYRGQKIILVEEYTGWLPWAELLGLLDRYPYQMEYKGGSCWRISEKIYITSNKHPRDWHTKQDELYEALERRCTSIRLVVAPSNCEPDVD